MFDPPDDVPLLHRLLYRRVAERVAESWAMSNGRDPHCKENHTWYVMLDRSAVATRQLGAYVAAVAACEMARRELGLPSINLRWFRTVSAAWQAGWAACHVRSTDGLYWTWAPAQGLHRKGGWIAVHTGMGPWSTASTTMHEVRHVWQRSRDVKDHEADAERYQREAIGRFWPKIRRMVEKETGARVRTPIWAPAQSG